MSPEPAGSARSRPERRHVRYPNHYTWFTLLAALDVMVTWMTLHVGGYEANPVANFFVWQWGLWGLLGLKFGALILVVCICEWIGDRRPRTGRRLAEWAVALNAVPVVVGLVQLLAATVKMVL